jgi:hypothetical protein
MKRYARRSALLAFSFFSYSIMAMVPAQDLPHRVFQKSNTSAFCKAKKELNFGVLVQNKHYHIYRSSGLGQKGVELLASHLQEQDLPFPQKILYLNEYGYGVPTYESVVDGHVPLGKAIAEMGEPIVSGPYEWFFGYPMYGRGPFAREEKSIAIESGRYPFVFLHGGNRNVFLDGFNPLRKDIEAKDFQEDNGKWITRKGDREALYQVAEEILTSESATLFHCKMGIHRTGITGLLIRYLQGGIWTEVYPAADLEKQRAYYAGVPIPGGVQIRNLAQLEYLQHNQFHFRSKNWMALEMLAREPRFQCLKSQFGSYLNVAPREEEIVCLGEREQIAYLQSGDHGAIGQVSLEYLGVEERRNRWDHCRELEIQNG